MNGPLTVETGGDKLYLFTKHSIEEYEATKHYTYSDPIPGRPLSRKDCLRIASALLAHAVGRGAK